MNTFANSAYSRYMEVSESILQEQQRPAGTWVSTRTYAQIHGLAPQTLANWRYRDRKEGRSGAKEGYPKYRYFGAAVRYFLESNEGLYIDPFAGSGALISSATKSPRGTGTASRARK